MGNLIKLVLIFFGLSVVYGLLYYLFKWIPEDIGWKTLNVVVCTVVIYLLVRIIKLIRLLIIKNSYNKRVEEFALLLEEKCNKMGMFTSQELFDEVLKCPRCMTLLGHLLICNIKYRSTTKEYVMDYVSILCEGNRVTRKCVTCDESGKRTDTLFASVEFDDDVTNMLPPVVMQID